MRAHISKSGQERIAVLYAEAEQVLSSFRHQEGAYWKNLMKWMSDVGLTAWVIPDRGFDSIIYQRHVEVGSPFRSPAMIDIRFFRRIFMGDSTKDGRVSLIPTYASQHPSLIRSQTEQLYEVAEQLLQLDDTKWQRLYPAYKERHDFGAYGDIELFIALQFLIDFQEGLAWGAAEDQHIELWSSLALPFNTLDRPACMRHRHRLCTFDPEVGTDDDIYCLDNSNTPTSSTEPLQVRKRIIEARLSNSQDVCVITLQELIQVEERIFESPESSEWLASHIRRSGRDPLYQLRVDSLQ